MPFPADTVLVGCNAHSPIGPVKGVDQKSHFLAHAMPFENGPGSRSWSVCCTSMPTKKVNLSPYS
jgi:hypothetical protein